jgi:hypothetical protein
VPGWRVHGTFRRVGDDRCHERVAELAGDLLGQGPRSGVVLAQRNVRSALLGTADGNDDRRLPGANLVAQFRPCQVFEEYRSRGKGVDAHGRGQQRDGCAFRERGIHPRILGDAVTAGQLKPRLFLS